MVLEVGGKLEVYLDGGVRQGTDVLKALALGARAVFVGRPVLWGLACGGREGVENVLSMLTDELALAMQLAGKICIAYVLIFFSFPPSPFQFLVRLHNLI